MIALRLLLALLIIGRASAQNIFNTLQHCTRNIMLSEKGHPDSVLKEEEYLMLVNRYVNDIYSEPAFTSLPPSLADLWSSLSAGGEINIYGVRPQEELSEEQASSLQVVCTKTMDTLASIMSVVVADNSATGFLAESLRQEPAVDEEEDMPPLENPPLGDPPLGDPPLGEPPLGEPPADEESDIPAFEDPPLGEPFVDEEGDISPLEDPPLGEGEEPLESDAEGPISETPEDAFEGDLSDEPPTVEGGERDSPPVNGEDPPLGEECVTQMNFDIHIAFYEEELAACGTFTAEDEIVEVIVRAVSNNSVPINVDYSTDTFWDNEQEAGLFVRRLQQSLSCSQRLDSETCPTDTHQQCRWGCFDVNAAPVACESVSSEKLKQMEPFVTEALKAYAIEKDEWCLGDPEKLEVKIRAEVKQSSSEGEVIPISDEPSVNTTVESPLFQNDNTDDIPVSQNPIDSVNATEELPGDLLEDGPLFLGTTDGPPNATGPSDPNGLPGDENNTESSNATGAPSEVSGTESPSATGVPSEVSATESPNSTGVPTEFPEEDDITEAPTALNNTEAPTAVNETEAPTEINTTQLPSITQAPTTEGPLEGSANVTITAGVIVRSQNLTENDLGVLTEAFRDVVTVLASKFEAGGRRSLLRRRLESVDDDSFEIFGVDPADCPESTGTRLLQELNITTTNDATSANGDADAVNDTTTGQPAFDGSVTDEVPSSEPLPVNNESSAGDVSNEGGTSGGALPTGSNSTGAPANGGSNGTNLPTAEACQKISILYSVVVEEGEDPEEVLERFSNATREAIDDGELQESITNIDPNSSLIVEGSTEPPPAPTQPPVSTPSPTVPSIETVAPSVEATQAPEEKDGDGDGNMLPIIIGVVVAVAVLCGCTGIIYYWMQRNKVTDDDEVDDKGVDDKDEVDADDDLEKGNDGDNEGDGTDSNSNKNNEIFEESSVAGENDIVSEERVSEAPPTVMEPVEITEEEFADEPGPEDSTPKEDDLVDEDWNDDVAPVQQDELEPIEEASSEALLLEEEAEQWEEAEPEPELEPDLAPSQEAETSDNFSGDNEREVSEKEGSEAAADPPEDHPDPNGDTPDHVEEGSAEGVNDEEDEPAGDEEKPVQDPEEEARAGDDSGAVDQSDEQAGDDREDGDKQTSADKEFEAAGESDEDADEDWDDEGDEEKPDEDPEEQARAGDDSAAAGQSDEPAGEDREDGDKQASADEEFEAAIESDEDADEDWDDEGDDAENDDVVDGDIEGSDSLDLDFNDSDNDDDSSS